MWCVVGGGGWEMWWEEVGVWWVGGGRGCGGGGRNSMWGWDEEVGGRRDGKGVREEMYITIFKG